jgi:hypothetical protein
MKRSILTLFILISFLFASAQRIELKISGDANFDNSLFSISEAGLDFSSDLESQSSIYLSVSKDNVTQRNNFNSKWWTIKVYKQDNWNSDMKLQIQRTGKGNRVGNNGNPNIGGGSEYLIVQNTETDFFEGKGEVSNIPVSLKLSGISVTMGAGSYSSRMIFTIYDSW